jgi:curved DNA-binding protein CbpA
MSIQNFYEILELKSNCSSGDIKKAFRILVKKYHPDRPNGDEDKFEAVTQAYNVLINDKSRHEYDKIYYMEQQASYEHIALKEQHKNFNKKNNKFNESEKNEAIRSFNKYYEDNDNDNDNKMNMNEANNILRDLENMREYEDIENNQEKIFENNKFDESKFNKYFEKCTNINNNHIQVEHHNDSNYPFAWDSSNDMFESLSLVNQSEFIQIEPKKIKKYYEHYEEDIEIRLKKYEQEREKINNLDFNDFLDTTGGYGITEHITSEQTDMIEWQ